MRASAIRLSKRFTVQIPPLPLCRLQFGGALSAQWQRRSIATTTAASAQASGGTHEIARHKLKSLPELQSDAAALAAAAKVAAAKPLKPESGSAESLAAPTADDFESDPTGGAAALLAEMDRHPNATDDDALALRDDDSDLFAGDEKHSAAATTSATASAVSSPLHAQYASAAPALRAEHERTLPPALLPVVSEALTESERRTTALQQTFSSLLSPFRGDRARSGALRAAHRTAELAKANDPSDTHLLALDELTESVLTPLLYGSPPAESFRGDGIEWNDIPTDHTAFFARRKRSHQTYSKFLRAHLYSKRGTLEQALAGWNDLLTRSNAGSAHSTLPAIETDDEPIEDTAPARVIAARREAALAVALTPAADRKSNSAASAAVDASTPSPADSNTAAAAAPATADALIATSSAALEPPSVELYTLLIRVCSRYGDLTRVRQAYRMMRAADLTPETPELYNALTRAFAERGEIARAYSILDIMKADTNDAVAANDETYNALIYACWKGGDPDLAWQTFDAMMPLSVMPTTKTCDLMIRVAAVRGDIERAESVLRWMKDSGVARTEVTYNNLILASSKRYGFYVETFDYYKEMVAQGLQPTLYTYHALMNATATFGDASNAQLLFNQLPAVGLAPNSLTYTFLIESIANSQHKHRTRVGTFELSQTERIALANELLAEVKSKSLPVTVRMCNSVLKTYAHALHLTSAVNAFDTLYAANKLEPDYNSFAVLFKMYCATRKLDRALKVLDVMRTSKGWQIRGDLLWRALKLCYKLRAESEGKSLLVEMKNAGMDLPLDDITVRAFAGEADLKRYDDEVSAGRVAHSQRHINKRRRRTLHKDPMLVRAPGSARRKR